MFVVIDHLFAQTELPKGSWVFCFGLAEGVKKVLAERLSTEGKEICNHINTFFMFKFKIISIPF